MKPPKRLPPAVERVLTEETKELIEEIFPVLFRHSQAVQGTALFTLMSFYIGRFPTKALQDEVLDSFYEHIRTVLEEARKAMD